MNRAVEAASQEAHDTRREALTSAAPPHQLAPAIVEAPWTQTLLARAKVVELAEQLPVGAQHRDKRRGRGSGADRLLLWLETFPGPTWQQRWEASGSQELGRAWAEAPTRFIETIEPFPTALVARRTAIVGIHALLCTGVLRPSYRWLFDGRFKDTYAHVRQLHSPDLFDEMAAICREAGHRERHILDAFNHISRVVLHTGRDPRDLTSDDLVSYHATLRSLKREANNIGLTWDLLRETSVFPPGTAGLPDFRRRGQRSVEELVDSYNVTCQPIRDVLVRYLNERAAALDYSSLRGLIGNLVGNFWKDLEDHHPSIASLRLPPDVVTAWKQRLSHTRLGNSRKKQTKARTDRYQVLFVVRAFYLDISQWALEDPSWVPWVAPNPITDDDVRGSMKHQRRRRAKMHQRTRTLAPMLPQLVTSVEDRLEYVQRLAEAAAAATVGDTFTMDGQRFQRTQALTDRHEGGQAGARRLRVRRLADDTDLDLTKDEDEAFWTWAIVETLRHTGIRAEEMLELTHLALVSHTLADTGEVIPMLQVAPSKQDVERLLLVSPELAHVLARIIHRVREGHEHVPLVARYDHHERLLGPPLPHLFQRRRGTLRGVITPSVIKRLLDLAIERLGLQGADGLPLRYTPHDFRRIFATEAVSAGLPVHIAAKLLGHRDLNTTQRYVAVYQDDVIRHYSAFIARRRAERPSEEYREPTAAEWTEFEQHFTKRKVELGTCARPYGSPCRHEHACIRCPMLRPDPAQEPRLLAIIVNLNDRLHEAQDRGWLGEVDGLKVSLDAAHQKLTLMRKVRAQAPVLKLSPTRLLQAPGRNVPPLPPSYLPNP